MLLRADPVCIISYSDYGILKNIILRLWIAEEIQTNGETMAPETKPLRSAAIGAVAGIAVVATAPMILGAAAGVASSGPVAGGLFAAYQGAGVVAGSIMAALQSAVMCGASSTACAVGGVTGAAVGYKLPSKLSSKLSSKL